MGAGGGESSATASAADGGLGLGLGLGLGKQEQERFRSVLPQEPVPCSVDDLGYIHLQGSFMPKVVGSRKEGAAMIRDILPDEIEAAILDALTPKTHPADASSTVSILSGLPPYIPISVHVCDPSNPPYAKVRVTYKTAREARDVVSFLRHKCISPSHLLSAKILPNQSGRNHDDDKSVQWKFSTRTVQATQITHAALPAEEMCWSRSNPPKFRRLLHTREGNLGEDARTLREKRESTRFVFMTNILVDDQTAGGATGDAASALAALSDAPHRYLDALRTVLDPFDSTGYGVEIFLQSSKAKKWLKSIHVGMRTHEDAVSLVEELQGRSLELELFDNNGKVAARVQTGRLFLDFVAPTQRPWEKVKRGDVIVGSSATCTSSTSNVSVPGLVIIPDFLSKDEEATLMALLTGPAAPWAPSQATMSKIGSGNVRRRVQHYGYVFDYETADVLRDRSAKGAGCPPMPAAPKASDEVEPFVSKALKTWNGWEVFAGVIQRTRLFDFDSRLEATKVSFPDLNQLTVNEYKPGQGIGSHVDTPSAFGDGLISISLNGGTVMEFRRQGNEQEKDGRRKLVHLPPRSLCLMSGPARYEWEHMIVSRMTDTVDGVVMPRELRVSLTLRTALCNADDVSKEAKPLPLVESSSWPLRWTGECGSIDNKHAEDNDEESNIATPATERDHVHAVYDAIATQWHHTRGKRGVLWPGATQFLKELPKGSVVADVGCGDGKYFPAIYEAGSYVIGSDISLPLLRTAVEAGKHLKLCGSDSAPESRRVRTSKETLNWRPSVAVADCMHVPLRAKSVDAAICIAVMHHLSTIARRIRCLQELARIVRVGGLINVQAWAMDQEEGSKRRFAATDVFVPFNVQPKYLENMKGKNDSNDANVDRTIPSARCDNTGKGVAQMCSEAYDGAEFDERKGLVVFQRYCHLYCNGELEELASEIDNTEMVESGFESGNYFIILRVIS